MSDVFPVQIYMKSCRQFISSNRFFLLLLFGLVCLFFYPFILLGRIPIPADTIVGLYHPWRDVIWNNLTTGVPFKNFLITDPVRQQYVWRKLAIDQIKAGYLPLWNPYSFSGTPLLANFQSAALYPLNILFFLLPFPIAWGILIFLQPLLAGTFLYIYLRNHKVSQEAGMIGGIVFGFCGFSIAWLEWNTIGHVLLWVPLILLCIDYLLDKFSLKWILILIFAQSAQILAGHLQFLFYAIVLSCGYLFSNLFHQRKIIIRKMFLFLFISLIVLVITSPQLIPTAKFISQSARNFDQGDFRKEGWFLPNQNLIQFVAPDFFGNPATNNYWGVWNYGEFVGYIGLLPLILAVYAVFYRRDKLSIFFTGVIIIGLLLALSSPLSQLPFLLKIPLISTSQPTRFLMLVDIALPVLAALGYDQLKKEKSLKKILGIYIPIAGLFIILFLVTSGKIKFLISVPTEFQNVSRRNLYFPVGIFIFSGLLLYLYTSKKRFGKPITTLAVLLIVVIDLFRFGWKFTPFTGSDLIFPETKIIKTLKEDTSQWRMMTLDRRIFPPNFSDYYHLQDVSGYDPLYLLNYGQFVVAWERNKPDITPAAFNRILTPTNFENPLTDLLGVKYILSMTAIDNIRFSLVLKEGQTYLYQNNRAFPRAFLTNGSFRAKDDASVMQVIFNLGDNLGATAVVEDDIYTPIGNQSPEESVVITQYSPEIVQLTSKTYQTRMLVLTDPYYPTWKAFVDNIQTPIYRTDFLFRGIIVPAGTHRIEFRNNIL
jgi:hypothetical protein